MTLFASSLRAAVIAVFITLPSAGAAGAAPALRPMTAACDSLVGLKVAAERIGLPTRGAEVTAATAVPARADGAHPFGSHCKVSGVIHPVDPNAFDIRFEVRLPEQWNGKGLMMGGGGFSGNIPTLDESQYNSLPGSPSALARSYAVFGGDSGHQEDKAAPGAFLMNDEAYANWASDHIKKTRDAAVAVIAAAYGAPPATSYFVGGSTGGREGLIAAGRWPTDWDGVVSLYPARDQAVELLGGMGINQAFMAPGAYPSQAKRLALLRAARQACDGLDGLEDGLISAVAQCNARFDPRTALLDKRPLRCPEGADTGDSCLSDAQLKALAVMQNEQPFGFTLASGESSFPGYNVYTSDTGIAKDHPLQQMVIFLALGLAPPAFPPQPGSSLMVTFGDNIVRYGIARDPSLNPLTVGPTTLGAHRQRIIELSRWDIPERNLNAFAARGGKLIVMHGLADMIVSPRNSEHLYATLQKTMGKAKVADFMRFYEVPGFAHAVSSDFAAGWDYLSALERWREHGRDPGNAEVVVDIAGVPGRTRPLCQYPAWPRYGGTGDVNLAASFTCVTQ